MSRAGIVVASQQERSQGKNKATAMKLLKNRLYQLEADKQAAVKAKLDAKKADVTFGSQIRSYVFQPYTMVNDHRTELKITDVQKVMDGGIDPFIEAYLKASVRRAGSNPVARSVMRTGRPPRDGGGGAPDDLNFVLRDRRAKLDALSPRGSSRSRIGSPARTRRARHGPRCPRAPRRDRSSRRRAAWCRGGHTARRPSRISRTRVAASSSTSARISWAMRTRCSTASISATSSA